MSGPTIVPERDPLSAPYWEGAEIGELRLQRCAACASVWHPPLPRCPNCHAAEVEWIAAAGTGSVHTYTVVHQAAHPAFAGAVPYVVVLVRLEEGPLVVGNLVESVDGELVLSRQAPQVGAPVTVRFMTVADGHVLPQFALT